MTHEDTDDSAASGERTCAYCGNEIDTSEWHPVVGETDSNGTFRIRAFCDEACRDAWQTD